MIDRIKLNPLELYPVQRVAGIAYATALNDAHRLQHWAQHRSKLIRYISEICKCVQQYVVKRAAPKG